MNDVVVDVVEWQRGTPPRGAVCAGLLGVTAVDWLEEGKMEPHGGRHVRVGHDCPCQKESMLALGPQTLQLCLTTLYRRLLASFLDLCFGNGWSSCDVCNNGAGLLPAFLLLLCVLELPLAALRAA